jgi:purine-nucleoside phosphorylase
MLPDKTTEIETTFLELAEQWRQETGMLSVTSKMSMHPAYQRIIGMGQPVIPLIMRELKREPDH